MHLSDGAVDVLRNGKFNHRLLCELIVHENFRRFMTDLEIYVDGYVSANIQNLNAGLEATRQMLKKKYAADENDLYMSTLKLGQIDEDVYKRQVLVCAVGDWGGKGSHDLSPLHQDTQEVLLSLIHI